MEILVHGRTTKKVLYGKCPRCECKFIATENECHFGKTYGYTTDCPECKALVILKYECEDKVRPNYWRDN